MKQSRRNAFELDALGTHWWFEFLEEHPGINSLKQMIDREVKRFEGKYSRFRADSVVGQLNDTGEYEYPSKELIAMIDFAQQQYIHSKGLFDISVGGALERLGYGRENNQAEPVQDVTSIRVSSEKIVLPLGMRIDFGGFGKGWLIDELGRLIHRFGIKSFIINGGGDILCHNETAIEFALEHPLDDTKMIGTTMIKNGALAVSSPFKRSWKIDETEYHHIINPATKQSNQGVIAGVYVKAKTARIADVIATVASLDSKIGKQLATNYNAQIISINKNQL